MMEQSESIESDLLVRISNGDKKAFARIYEIFYTPLLKHTTSKVGEITIAEDILHDLFLSLWNSREKLVDISSISAYLYTSCRYLTLKYFKKASNIDYNENWEENIHHSAEQSIEDKLYYRYLLDIINSEIENLPEKCKQVFKLSREEQKSNKEIALYLNISESTVENQINKALKRIRNSTRHLIFFYLIASNPILPPNLVYWHISNIQQELIM